MKVSECLQRNSKLKTNFKSFTLDDEGVGIAESGIQYQK